MMNGRLAVSTSFGDLILDSGAPRLVLFGVKSDAALGEKREWRTVSGSQQASLVYIKSLAIEGRTVWHGDAVAIPSRSEPGVDGLMPLSLFKAVYVCNSGSYIILD